MSAPQEAAAPQHELPSPAVTRRAAAPYRSFTTSLMSCVLIPSPRKLLVQTQTAVFICSSLYLQQSLFAAVFICSKQCAAAQLLCYGCSTRHTGSPAVRSGPLCSPSSA